MDHDNLIKKALSNSEEALKTANKAMEIARQSERNVPLAIIVGISAAILTFYLIKFFGI